MRCISLLAFVALVSLTTSYAQISMPKSATDLTKSAGVDLGSVTKAANSLNGNVDQLSGLLKSSGVDATAAKGLLSAVGSLDKDTDKLLSKMKGVSDVMSLQNDVSGILSDVRKVDNLSKGLNLAPNVLSKIGSVKSSASTLGNLFGLKL